MRRRSRLAVTLVALVAVGSIFVGTYRDPALAADPLSQAKQQQQQLQLTLSQQRSQLDRLKAASATLSDELDAAKAALADVTAEYEHVRDLLGQVRDQVAQVSAQLANLRARIKTLDQQLAQVAAEIVQQTNELQTREALLQDHLRAAYEQSQTSLLEVLLSSSSLDQASTQVSYMLNMSEQDTALAETIRALRQQLKTKQRTLAEGRAQLAVARRAAESQAALLARRQAQLAEMTTRLAQLQAAADVQRHQQEAALNAALAAKGNVQDQIAASERAAQAQAALVARLQHEAAARAAAVAAAQRLAAQEAARRHAEDANRVSARGFRWPEAGPRITQEWGPTDFVMEPPYTYNGTSYPHFHTGLDMASGCGSPILAAGTGVVAASGQPLWPWDSGYGVMIDHGGGIMTQYWHLLPQVIVHPGQLVTIGQLVGYEGATGNATGCHLHFAVNDNGVWQNPRSYLP